MAKVNFSFDLEPWCEGCPHLVAEKHISFIKGDWRITSLGCSQLEGCRHAVKAAKLMQIRERGASDA